MSSVAEVAEVAEVEEVAAALSAAVSARLDELGDLGLLDDRGLAQQLQELEVLRRRLEHAVISIVGEADRRGVWAIDGHRSVRGWCQATVNWSGADTTHRLRCVTLLRDVATVDAALADGTVGVAQVRELARARANPRCGSELAACADLLVDQARLLPFDEFRLVVHRWEALADVDGAHRDHEQSHAGRTVAIEPVGAGYTINGQCGVAQGAAMAEILERFCDTEFHADWDRARSRLGDDVTPSDLERTAAQRRMDALHAIFMAAAAAAPGGKPPEPLVTIVVDQTTFESAITAMAAGVPLDDVMPPVVDPTRRRCETIDGTLVDPYDAVVAALVGHVRRVVFNSASCTIDLGAASRLFRGTSRLAVWLQGTRCLWPGCGRHHCQIDHNLPWSNHGRTVPTNGGPACAHHNRWKTRGYHTHRDASGHWHIHRPDGSEITPI